MGEFLYIFIRSTKHLTILICYTVKGAEHLTLSTLGRSRLNESQSDDEKGDRSKSTFREDESIPAPFRARLKDYFRSGYDRGHM